MNKWDDVARQRRLWEREAPRYDRQIAFFERRFFGDARAWACAHASGDVLEVAVGTGRNLSFYPDDVRLTGIDLSPAMLAIARDRAADLGREVDLREGNAHELAFPDASFDTVVCTFSLCNIPDERRAVAEMRRVLRPGGLLVLADHVASDQRLVLAVQWLFEKLTYWMAGDHQTRHPLPIVEQTGFVIEERQRYAKGIVERLTARKPISG
jgi:ubiquinone/menaquinone biosynthesis C-methylase UbiE